jgi:multiple sugar transport system substrate-binding protein
MGRATRRLARGAIVGVAVAAVAAAVVGTSGSAVAQRSAKTDGALNIMGFGTNGDEIAMTRFNLAKSAVKSGVNAPNGGFNDQQFLAAVASGSPPDLIYLDRYKVGTYAAKGALQPLTTCIKSHAISMTQYRKPAVTELTYKGQVYGIPEFYDNRTVIVNNTVLANAKVKLADVDTKDWTKLQAATKKLMAMSGGKLSRIGFDPKLPEFFPLWAKANGVDLLSADGLHAHLNDPRAVAALTYAVGLIKLQGGWGKFKSFRDTFDFFGAKNEYAKNQLGAFPMEDWYYNVLASNSPQVKITGVPFRDRQGNDIDFETGSAWAIPKGAKNVDAACQWMKVMTQVSTWMAAAKARVDANTAKHLPFTGLYTANATADQKIFDAYYKPINKYFDQAVKAVLKVQVHAFGMPSSPGSAEFQQAWQDAVNRVLQGQQSPKQALDQAQKEAQKAIDDAK